MLREPGGLKEDVIHIWSWRGRELARVTPEHMRCNDGEVFRSRFPMGEMPPDPTGKWACTTMTVGGQLVGVRKFEIVTPGGKSDGKSSDKAAPPASDAGSTRPLDAGADAPHRDGASP